MTKRHRKSISHVDFFFEDWLAGTATCTPDQRSVLITICCLIWSSNARVLDNDQVLARMNNMSTRRYRKVKSELLGMQKLWVEEGCIFQERAILTLENALKVKELAQKNGAKGGLKFAENLAKRMKNNNTGLSDPHFPAQSENQSETVSSHPLPRKGASSTSSTTQSIGQTERADADIDSDLALYTQEPINGADHPHPDSGSGDDTTPIKIGDEVAKAMARVRAASSALKKIQ